MLKTYLVQFQQLLITPAFASIVCVPVGITSSAVEIKICAITVNYKEKGEET